MAETARKRLSWYAVSISIIVIGLVILLASLTLPTDDKRYATALDERGYEIALPVRWGTRVGHGESRRFTLNVDIEDLPQGPIYLYVPAYAQRLQIRVNDTAIGAAPAAVIWQGPASSAMSMEELPAALLHVGENKIDLLVKTGPVAFGSLSPVFVGPEQALFPHFRLQYFMRMNLPAILFGSNFFLGMCCWILFLVHRKEVQFAWLGTSMVATLLYSIGIFAEILPYIYPFAALMLVLVGPAAMGFLGFIAIIAGHRPTALWSWITAGVPLLALFLVVFGFYPLAATVLYFILPVALASLLAALVILLRLFWAKPALDLAILTPGVILMIGGTVYDHLSRMGQIDSFMMLAQPTRVILLIGFASYMMLRVATVTRDLDRAAMTMSEQLRKQEVALSEAFVNQRAAAEIEASNTERARILAELHDGVAGHLSTIVALTETQKSPREEIREVARDALSELRLLIDALDLPESDLRAALAAMCERSVKPLGRLGIRTDWSFSHLPEVAWMSKKEILSILRILQEAISNAVRHGEPATIHVSGSAVNNGLLCLQVINSGGKAFTSGKTAPGHGLQNMRSRAGKLSGHVVFTPTETGTTFALYLPINSLSHD